MYLRQFDPWKSKLCTCPKKYSLNPYTGCAHGCLYCYASSYIKDFFRCRPKQKLIETLKRDILKIPTNSLISLCNTSDPYPPVEKEMMLTRQCLKIFKDYGMRVLVITKSDIVTRDIDLLKDMVTAVTVTVTTLRHYRKIEPNASTPFQRLKAVERLSKEGIPTGLRLDPIIPFINENEIDNILKLAKESGVKHITASTFKPRWDSAKRLLNAFPEIREKIEKLYFKEHSKISNSWYLPKPLRKYLIQKLRQICDELKISFSSCREGFPEFSTGLSCDGSHLIEHQNFSQELASTVF